MLWLIRTFVLVVSLAALATTQSGCLLAAAAGATAGGVMYVKGDTDAAMPAPTRQVTQAAAEAVRELDLVLVSSTSTDIDGRVEARTAGDAKVVIVIKSAGENASRVSVRVGTFGDEVLQQNLLKRIREKLQAA